MSEPKRIQLRRTKGWRKPVGAVKVDRSTKWGNGWIVGYTAERGWFAEALAPATARLDLAERIAFGGVTRFRDRASAAAFAVHCYRQYHLPRGANDPAELRGHDLACWCPLDQPCHADVLLELANPTTEVRGADPSDRDQADGSPFAGGSSMTPVDAVARLCTSQARYGSSLTAVHRAHEIGGGGVEYPCPFGDVDAPHWHAAPVDAVDLDELAELLRHLEPPTVVGR